MAEILSYVKHPAFWIAVILVAVVVNYAWKKFGGKGKLA